jgi:pyruvate/2-oxoglutarate dehydrogenase complex dihydrolipoamide acyltransferase (E2) component
MALRCCCIRRDGAAVSRWIDHVVTDQPLVSVETDKAVVEIPSPSSGRIAHLFGTKGDIVKVGTPLVEFAEGAEPDTGTIVGELGTGAHPLAAEISSAPPTAQEPQVFPAVRALARKLDLATHKLYDEKTVLRSVAKTGRCVIVHVF